MLDSLVRVSRRVVQGQTWKPVQTTAVPKETMQQMSHALTLVLFSNLHRLPLEVHHTAISHRRLPSVHLALSRDRFPFNNFTCYLTPFSRCFSSFPHGTCSLSVSCQYLALDGIYHPFELHSQATRLVDIRDSFQFVSRRDCHPLWCSIPGDLNTTLHIPTCLEITIHNRNCRDSKFELFPLHSPLLRES
jgi:hypothetical protein